MKEITKYFIADNNDLHELNEWQMQDRICEWADGRVDCYYADLMKWATRYPQEVNEVINNYGWDGCGRSIDRAIMIAQAEHYENELLEDFDEIMACTRTDEDEED